MPVSTSISCPAAEGCIEACERTLEAAAHLGPMPEVYAAVGPHLRHCIDHFTCFFRGIEAGTIDYDSRDREPSLESEPAALRAAVEAVIERLKKLDGHAASSGVRVCQIPATGQDAVVVESTLDRELLFLSGHTILHLAIIVELAQVAWRCRPSAFVCRLFHGGASGRVGRREVASVGGEAHRVHMVELSAQSVRSPARNIIRCAQSPRTRTGIHCSSR